MYVDKFEMREIIKKKATRRSPKWGESTQKCFQVVVAWRVPNTSLLCHSIVFLSICVLLVLLFVLFSYAYNTSYLDYMNKSIKGFARASFQNLATWCLYELTTNRFDGRPWYESREGKSSPTSRKSSSSSSTSWGSSCSSTLFLYHWC